MTSGYNFFSEPKTVPQDMFMGSEPETAEPARNNYMGVSDIVMSLGFQVSLETELKVEQCLRQRGALSSRAINMMFIDVFGKDFIRQTSWKALLSTPSFKAVVAAIKKIILVRTNKSVDALDVLKPVKTLCSSLRYSSKRRRTRPTQPTTTQPSDNDNQMLRRASNKFSPNDGKICKVETPDYLVEATSEKAPATPVTQKAKKGSSSATPKKRKQPEAAPKTPVKKRKKAQKGPVPPPNNACRVLDFEKEIDSLLHQVIFWQDENEKRRLQQLFPELFF